MSTGKAGPPVSPLPEDRRLEYLEAMGIPAWLPRASRQPAEAENPTEAAAGPAPSETSEAAMMTAPPTPEPGQARAGQEPAPSAPPVTAATAASPPTEEGGIDAGTPAAPGEIGSMDWTSLREAILGCTRCGLCESRTRAVPGVGNPQADLLVIGEAPGQEEDRQGEPFVGRAGQLLDRMLAAIGLDRQKVFITNVLKCRPPNNRDPAPEEVQACAPYLRRQIELIEPRVILSVGRVSAQNLLEASAPLGRLRGEWHRFGPKETPLLVTYHPAYLLRSPAAKRQAWADLKQVRDRLRE